MSTPKTDALLNVHAYGSVPNLESRYLSMCEHARQLETEAERLRVDAARYRLYRLYKTTGVWPTKMRGRPPGVEAWGGNCGDGYYTGENIDKLLDEMLNSAYSKPIIDAAIAATTIAALEPK